MLERMPWLYAVPWIFLLLGIAPLWFYPQRDGLYPGLAYLMAALILTGVASLYNRTAASVAVRLCWVLGLGLMAYTLAIYASLSLTVLPGLYEASAAAAALGTGIALLCGLYFLQRREIPPLPKLQQERYRERGGAMNRAALMALAPSLEPLAAARPVMLLMLQTPPEQSPEPIVQTLRGPDLVFNLSEGKYLLILQEGGPQAVAPVFKRLKQNLNIQAYAALPYEGGPLDKALEQLEAELEHIYLTQPGI
jgi:hypothetical protein